ncbi:response regulator transcription factor [Paenibacillus sp. W2I17]|uniref:response regulator n=1 Tax=Paenibacillus sp. W2I17 TaxID=3042311 RepID=UPI0027830DD7|nr:response regulator transcription factor [Paenibacillus sp. W2I17]MDQ0655974.1 NarL family two-component system response regulator YdfI [Paenibacillus sp. W2I17]
MSPYKIMLVDDHFVVREGLKLILETSEKYQVVGEAVNGQDALEKVEKLEPDIILMDLNMPVLSGLETMKEFKKKGLTIPIIILTTYNEDELMINGLALGAKGYLLKDTSRESLFRSIDSAMQGEMLLSEEMLERVMAAKLKSQQEVKQDVKLLSDKENYILQCVAKGYKSKEIAFDMNIGERTVKAHLTNIYNKLGVDSRSQAVATALDRGILKL